MVVCSAGEKVVMMVVSTVDQMDASLVVQTVARSVVYWVALKDETMAETMDPAMVVMLAVWLVAQKALWWAVHSVV